MAAALDSVAPTVVACFSPFGNAAGLLTNSHAAPAEAPLLTSGFVEASTFPTTNGECSGGGGGGSGGGGGDEGLRLGGTFLGDEDEDVDFDARSVMAVVGEERVEDVSLTPSCGGAG